RISKRDLSDSGKLECKTIHLDSPVPSHIVSRTSSDSCKFLPRSQPCKCSSSFSSQGSHSLRQTKGCVGEPVFKRRVSFFFFFLLTFLVSVGHNQTAGTRVLQLLRK